MIRKPNPQAQARVLVSALKSAGVELKLSTALDIVARQHGHKSWNVMAAVKPTPAPSAVRASTATPSTSPLDQSLNGWSVGDVLSVRPDLYPSEAFGVLQEASRRMDATIGINWDTLSYHANDMFPEHRTAILCACINGSQKMVELDLANGDVFGAHGESPDSQRIVLQSVEDLQALSPAQLVDTAEFELNDFTASLGELRADAMARFEVLQQLGDARLLQTAEKSAKLPFEMTVTIGAEGTRIEASGLFKALEAPTYATLPADCDVDTAVASGAAEALTSFVLALAANGIDVSDTAVTSALTTTTDALANALS